MGRRKASDVLEHFEQTNGVSKCKYCELELNGKPSVTRLRKHLLGESNGGIRVCPRVPDDVKEALADHSSKRPRVDAGSGNNVVRNSISTSAAQQNNGFGNQVQDGERMQEGLQKGMLQYSFEGFGVDSIEHGAILEEPGALETRADALLTTELVGRTFQKTMEEICSSIMVDEVLRIGIYGMGGVGKTELAKHVHNKILESRNFHQVYWVTVSPDFSVHSLQNAIAKAVKLDFSNQDDENKRAVMLLKKLMEKKKCVLFLDNVWRSDISLGSVGIPIRLNGCKVILTTRSLEVCQRMDCMKNIKVECLPKWFDTGAWDLFIKILGRETELPSELEQIADSIVEKCEGLPLMIISMARSMKGVDDIREWRNALEELKGSKLRQDNVEVFKKLKLSYVHLKDPTLQKCFLFCAMFDDIDKEALTENLIVEGITGGMNSRRADYDKGHTMLNKLQNACLLEVSSNVISMHGLIRHMAIQVMKESMASMVEVGKQLTCLPENKWWTEDIVRVSLMNNDIEEIPAQFSPRCPYLSTLLLCGNRSLKSITEHFFDQLYGLKVLNLSQTWIEKLPESVANLENLTALILRDCEHLTSIPSLRKLRALEMLDLYRSKYFEKVPEGLESLVNLNYLNLLRTRVQELRAGILEKLSRLQWLGFFQSSGEVEIKGKELGGLCNLETLFWRFNDGDDFNNYISNMHKDGDDFNNYFSNMHKEKQKLSNYVLLVGSSNDICDFNYVGNESGQFLYFRRCNMSREVLLPKDVQKLHFFFVTIHNGRSLCLKNAIDLKEFNIQGCTEIEYLFCLSPSTSIFQTLEALEVSSMDNLRGLFSREGDDGLQPPTPTPIQLLPNATFSHLKKFTISGCDSVKKLFPCALLSNLQNLQWLQVSVCKEMEEIIASEEEGSSSHSIFTHTLSTLPNLCHLKLQGLPKLKSISNAKLNCYSLEYVEIDECPKLKKIPILLPLSSLKEIQVKPEEWWESVEWGDPNEKINVQPTIKLNYNPFSFGHL